MFFDKALFLGRKVGKMIIFHPITNQDGGIAKYIFVDVDVEDTLESHNEIGLCFKEQEVL